MKNLSILSNGTDKVWACAAHLHVKHLHITNRVPEQKKSDNTQETCLNQLHHNQELPDPLELSRLLPGPV